MGISHGYKTVLYWKETLNKTIIKTYESHKQNKQRTVKTQVWCLRVGCPDD